MLEKKLYVRLVNENSLIDRVKSATVKYIGNAIVAVGITLASVGCNEEYELCSNPESNYKDVKCGTNESYVCKKPKGTPESDCSCECENLEDSDFDILKNDFWYI
ncbi:hypothetical protein J4232_01960 [Candidatus Woesearchaeota archaeon]|nr:hypothetical protein [Candidatus Woesearchaeota archaeon]